MNNIDTKYDAVIIGAGIGGLICGCYLARAGMKVLIVEKNNKPGGYCTSFDKDNFRFDLCVHSLGSLRDGGILNKIFNDIGILNDINIIRTDPTNTVITPDFEFSFYCNKDRTLENFKKLFPKDIDDINNFFNLIFGTEMHSLFLACRRKNFKNVLDKNIKNYKIKCLIYALLGNVGLPPEYLSSFTALMMIKEFIFDGGYHIKGGIQVLPNKLAEALTKYGSHIVYNTEVDHIYIKNDKAVAIGFKKNSVEGRYIISASDAYNVFHRLIKRSKHSTKTLETLKNLIPTSSAFILFLGLKKNTLKFHKKSYSIWFCPTYFINKYFPNPYSNKEYINKKSILFYLPTTYDTTLVSGKGSIIAALVNFNYKNSFYWQRHSTKIKSFILDSLKNSLGIIKSDIIIDDFKSPHDLFLLTNNYKGSMRGWASTPEQNSRNIFPQHSIFKNLFFVGHWTTTEFGQGGLSNVANTARRVSEEILRKEKFYERNMQ